MMLLILILLVNSKGLCKEQQDQQEQQIEVVRQEYKTTLDQSLDQQKQTQSEQIVLQASTDEIQNQIQKLNETSLDDLIVNKDRDQPCQNNVENKTFDIQLVQNNPQVYGKKFDVGYNSWFLDLIDSMFEQSFEKECTEAFDHYLRIKPQIMRFKSKNGLLLKSRSQKFFNQKIGPSSFNVKGPPKRKKPTREYPLVTINGLNQALKDFKQESKHMTGEYLLKKYIKKGETRVIIRIQRGLNFREFIYFLIDTLEEMPYLTAQHSLQETRKQILNLFQFIDCKEQGIIDVEQIYNAFQKLETQLIDPRSKAPIKIKVTSFMINVFVVKASKTDLQLNFQQFMTEILYGMLERHFNDNEWDISKLNVQKIARLDDFINGKKFQ